MNAFLNFLFWVIIAAVVFSLVRPGSKAGRAVVDITDAFASVVGLATGYVQRGST